MNGETNREAEIAMLLQEDLRVEAPSAHEDLIETGVLDSLKIVELLAALEQRFAIRFPFSALDIDNFRSLEAITELVRRVEAGQPDSAAVILRDPTTPPAAADAGRPGS